MGKGVVPDDHPECGGGPDVCLAKRRPGVFDWRPSQLDHAFWLAARFRKDLRVVQLDIAAEEIGTNVPTEVPLVGDAKAVMTQMVAALEEDPWQVSASSPLAPGLAGGNRRASRPWTRRDGREWPPR